MTSNKKLVLLLDRETQTYKAAIIHLSNKDIVNLLKLEVKA